MASARAGSSRVKVYKLEKAIVDDEETFQWIDQGTGGAVCEYDEEEKKPCIIVNSQKDDSLIFKTPLSPDPIYHEERGTLIVWQDQSAQDWALSFTDKSFCKDFGDHIAVLQEEMKRSEVVSDSEEWVDLVELPPVEAKNLELIHKVIRQVSKVNLASTLLNDVEYLDQLFNLKDTFADDDHRRHHVFFDIMKNIILLNDPNLLEVLFSERYILRLVDALEHDPEVPLSRRISHLDFLLQQSNLKMVVPIKNPYIVSKIHQTHRIKYLKDTVLSGALNEATQNTLGSMIFFNHYEIVTNLQEDENFLRSLVDVIQNATQEQQIGDLIGFLKQFCDISKSLSEEIRSRCFQVLLENGLATIFEKGFALTNKQVQANIIEIFGQAMTYRDIDIREHILNSAEKDYPLLTVLSDRMVTAKEPAVIEQFQELFCRLVDTTNMDKTWRRKEEFLTVTYKFWFPTHLLPSLLDTTASSTAFALRASLCDLTSFCVARHGVRSRSFVVSNQVLDNLLLPHNLEGPGFLVLAIIRLFRQVVGDKNRQTERYLITRHLFDPLMKVFRDNEERYNMINSAIVELFDFIDKEYFNNYRFISYLVERFRTDFERIDYVPTFKLLIKKYETRQELAENGDLSLAAETKTGKRLRSDEEEEDFFDLDVDQCPSTPPLHTDDSEESDIGADLPPLRKSENDEEDDEESIVPRKKRRKIEIKSITKW